MNFKEIIQTHVKTPASEGYIKNSSRLVTGLFVVAGVSYYFSKDYGGYVAIIALVIALMVMFGQKLMISQIRKDLADMHHAKAMFEQTQNADYLQFIALRSQQILTDNKVLTERAKAEIQQLQAFAEQKKS